MAIRFAFIFIDELKQGLAFLHFNRPKPAEGTISCLQASHQQATEQRLLELVHRAGYPHALIWEDREHVARYRYIKLKP